jgi:hypothetical protein
MKTKKSTLRIETLEDRNMLSASPLGITAAPDVAADTGTLRSWSITFPITAAEPVTLQVKMKETLVSGAQDDGSTGASDAVFTGMGGDELSLHVRLPPPRNSC